MALSNLLPIERVVAFLVFDGAYETVSSASELDFSTESQQALIS